MGAQEPSIFTVIPPNLCRFAAITIAFPAIDPCSLRKAHDPH